MTYRGCNISFTSRQGSGRRLIHDAKITGARIAHTVTGLSRESAEQRAKTWIDGQLDA